MPSRSNSENRATPHSRFLHSAPAGTHCCRISRAAPADRSRALRYTRPHAPAHTPSTRSRERDRKRHRPPPAAAPRPEPSSPAYRSSPAPPPRRPTGSHAPLSNRYPRACTRLVRLLRSHTDAIWGPGLRFDGQTRYRCPNGGRARPDRILPLPPAATAPEPARPAAEHFRSRL